VRRPLPAALPTFVEVPMIHLLLVGEFDENGDICRHRVNPTTENRTHGKGVKQQSGPSENRGK
jgi:hypothetical protein